jgi:hypothetical protein
MFEYRRTKKEDQGVMKHLREIVERQDLTEYYPFPSGKEVGQLKTPGSAEKAFRTPKKRRSEVDGPLLPSKKQAKSYARAGWENDKKKLKKQAKSGLIWLAKKLKEEEQLDELDKETLLSYANKAGRDSYKRRDRAKDYLWRARQSYREGKKKEAKEFSDKFAKTADKGISRMSYANKAMDKWKNK